MFGIVQERLVKSLQKIRQSLCRYMGPTCDCKYLSEDAKLGYSEASGCPEVSEAMEIIAVMTPEEFNAIRKRARISISELDQKEQNDFLAAVQKIKDRKRADKSKGTK